MWRNLDIMNDVMYSFRNVLILSIPVGLSKVCKLYKETGCVCKACRHAQTKEQPPIWPTHFHNLFF